MVKIEAMQLDSAHARAPVEIPAFCIDESPVTNLQYQEFVRDADALPPMHWGRNEPPGHLEDHPVVGISMDAARAYAAWRGARLPTCVEWEAAARGADGRAFPWGNEFDATRCHGPGENRTTAPVDTYPSGASPEGCVDLVGNAWEWTEMDDRVREPDSGYAWVYGGSHRHACHKAGNIARTSVNAGNSYGYLGFRCASDL